MAFFIRHSNNPEDDLKRGYSFVGYSLWPTKELAFEALAEYTSEMTDDFNLTDYMEENDYRVAQDNTTGLWGSCRSGLCAYTQYTTLEDAIEALDNDDYGCGGGGELAQYAVIFEGYKVYDQELDGLDSGISFRPNRIAYQKAL